MKRINYSPPRYLFRRHALVKCINKGNKAIEVGAGNLLFSQELTNYFNKVYALEIEKKVTSKYESLDQKTKSKITLINKDLFKFRTKEKFDYVVSCEVMEHVRNDKKFLFELKKLMTKDTKMLISVPARMKYWSVHDEVVGHYKRYEKDQTIELFNECGLEVERIISYGYPFINMLWRLRKIHGKLQQSEKSKLSLQERTQKSGIEQNDLNSFFGILINKYTFYLPNKFSEFFYNKDLSEGYVIVAKKLN